MNKAILKSGGIDYDYGTSRFVGRAALFEKALTRFTRDDTFSRVRAAYAADDRTRLLADAHEFKGMCGNIGLTTLYEASDALVRLLRAGTFTPEQLREAFALLESRYAAAHAAILAAGEEHA